MPLDRTNPPQASEMRNARISPRAKSLLGYAAIVALISASTGAMMLCPCDSVGIHDHYAISLVAVACFFAAGACFLVFRKMRRDSGTTAFLRIVGAAAIVGAAVFAELSAAMYLVAWLARRH